MTRSGYRFRVGTGFKVLAGVITGGAVVGSVLAPPASAITGEDVFLVEVRSLTTPGHLGANDALATANDATLLRMGYKVCDLLNRYRPSAVEGALLNNGVSDYNAGPFIQNSTVFLCPEHMGDTDELPPGVTDNRI